MKLYKVISKDNKAKDGGDFDYTAYLPKGDKKGKWTPTIKNILECSKGWHVTPYWNMFLYDTSNKIFEVEVKGMKENDSSVGVIDKYVCQSIRLVKEMIFTFDKQSNTGYRNTGNKNTGYCNTGYCNTGDRNTGDWNTGDRNTGNWNTGNWNTGYCNTGDRNTGDWNTGDWNTCNEETGFFNTMQSNTIRIFNKDCLKSNWENANKPIFLYFDLDTKLGYKKSFQKAFDNATKEDVELLIKLPNFDYKVFEEISGITKNMINKRLK